MKMQKSKTFEKCCGKIVSVVLNLVLLALPSIFLIAYLVWYEFPRTTTVVVDYIAGTCKIKGIK